LNFFWRGNDHIAGADINLHVDFGAFQVSYKIDVEALFVCSSLILSAERWSPTLCDTINYVRTTD